MKRKFASIVALLICVMLFVSGITFTFVPAETLAAEEYDTNYGFVAKNASSSILLQKDCVWLTAKAATTGNIFDYIYKQSIDPTNLEINYKVVNDTTRDDGTHSRFDIYILPSPNASLNDGVKIQMIQYALGAASEEAKHTIIVGSGPDGGWDNYAAFTEDYSVNLKLYKSGSTFVLSVNGQTYSFSGANANLLNSFSGKAYIRFTAHYQENGEASYGGDYAIYNIDDTKFGSDNGTKEDKSSDIGTEDADKFEGVYGDEITGKMEFSRTDFNNLTPEGTILSYSVTDEGFSLFGRNEENGFSAGVSYQPALTLDHTHELSYTIVMPEEIYCTTSQNYAEYSTFICAESNKNFSETVSLYLRASYKPGTDKASSNAPFVLEVILWDNASESLVVASNTVQIQPKSEEGLGNEITYRIVYDENSATYKLYVNGQRASNSSVEMSMTEYFDKMTSKYLSATVSYATSDRAAGGFTDDGEEMIGMTIKSINGSKIVNEEPDLQESIDIIVASTDITSVVLMWSQPVIDETDFDYDLLKLDGYRIVRLIGSTDENGIVTTSLDKEIFIDDIETTDLKEENLQPGTNYYYTIYAVRKNDDGSYTDVISSFQNKKVTTLSEDAHDMPTEVPSEEATKAPADKTAAPSDDEAESSGSSILPVILGAAAAVIAAVVVIIVKKKKG